MCCSYCCIVIWMDIRYWMFLHSVFPRYKHISLTERWMNCLIFILMKTDGKNQQPAQTLFPEFDLIPLWLCHFATTQQFANVFVGRRRGNDWGVSSIRGCIQIFFFFLSYSGMQMLTCFPLPSTQGQLGVSLIWYANAGCHRNESFSAWLLPFLLTLEVQLEDKDFSCLP